MWLWTTRETEMGQLLIGLGFHEMAYMPDYYEIGMGKRLFARRLDEKES
jgi:hypothetical protein